MKELVKTSKSRNQPENPDKPQQHQLKEPKVYRGIEYMNLLIAK